MFFMHEFRPRECRRGLRLTMAFVIVGVVLFPVFRTSAKLPSGPFTASIVIAVAIAATISVLLIVGPGKMRYIVRPGLLEVRTLFGRHWPRVTLRVAGTGAPGYYTGLFRADGATTRVYATDLHEGVLIERPVRVFLSPDDPAAFLARLREAGATVE